MEIVMVNDCAHVGETLIKYLPEDFMVLHLKRSRRFFDKTFGVAWRIFRANGDLYHVHYLLQDCYLALKFGKHPIIGHAHGSDLRETVKSRKWGWIVKYNLKNCNKILVAQPTILETAKKYNGTAEYFPIPYDPEVFYPKHLPPEREEKHVLLVSPHYFRVKGTDKFLHALAHVKIPFNMKAIRYGRDVEKAQILARKLGLRVEFIDKVPHHKMNKLYWEADVVLGSFGVGQLDTVAIEAMACGRPVVHHIIKEYFPNCPLEEIQTVKEAQEIIEKTLSSRKERERRVKKQLKYVEANHSAKILTQKLGNIYLKFLTGE
jgi:glycosyltransferase involved in cell wall biosynthesis